MRFKRSSGLTPSERILADCCDISFLQLWTYPNLYKKIAKELTDLLVVFGNEVIIFSVKSCCYPNTGDSALDWSRWYKRSITDSVHQLDQAERWLRNYPDHVFLDAKCTSRLPVSLPSKTKMRIHRVCIPLGSSGRAEAITGNPSLRIDPAIVDNAQEFTIGRVCRKGGFVHVFDEVCLEVVLRELSTIADFIHYLDSKAKLITSGIFKFSESELDILAYYIWNDRSFPITDRPFRFETDLWSKVEADSAFLRGRQENEISYFWDSLIEYITEHYLSETLESGNSLEVNDYEQLVRIMASESRFFRRVLAKAILERVNRAKQQPISTLLPSGQPNVNYVLYVGQGDQGDNYEMYRSNRASILKARCISAKAAKPDKRYIVGIALDANRVKGTSEDFLLLDTNNWTKAEIENAERHRQDFGHFLENQVIEQQIHEEEYPSA